jgi:hypothetical protein
MNKLFPLIIVIAAVSILTLSLSHVAPAEETESGNTASDEQDVRQFKKDACIRCCDKKFLVCINLNPDRRLCAAEKENCVATCKSEGVLPSSWSDCWPAVDEKKDD